MKKISKFLFVICFFVLGSTISVTAEENTQSNNEEVVETEEQEQKEETEEEPTENVKVDEDNESPELYNNDENLDQSKRNVEVIKKPIETPASVTGEKYQGSGTVTDFTTTGSKAFYTIKGTDNSVFYIVIDMDKTEDNVYFLSEINGEELTLEEVSSQSQPEPQSKPEPEPEPQSQSENEVNENADVNLTPLIFFVLVVIGIVLYYLFFGKLKKFNPLLNGKKQKNDKEDKEDKKEEVSKVHKEQEADSFVISDDEK